MSTMESRTDESPAAPALESAQGTVPGEEAARPAPASILERMLAGRTADEQPANALQVATISAWSGTAGVLADGCAARLSASCLLRPALGDRVLIWSEDDGRHWVLAILQRAREEAVTTLAATGPLAIEAPRVGVSAGAVHIAAEELLTSARNHHAVEDTRTETARVRITQVGTDIRRATTVHDTVEGTFLQRMGTWISNTTRDARLRARTFLFD